MKTFILSILLLFITQINLCKESEEKAMRELLSETPNAVITTKNLFEGKGNDIRYYIVNPKDKKKVEWLEEKALIYAQREKVTVVRVDSIHKANWYIRLQD